MAKVTEKKKIIRNLYKQVQENKKALESAAAGRYITDGNFRVNSSSAFLNIKTCNNVLLIRDALASLLSLKSAKKEANSILGIEETFTHAGATEEEWISDFKTRIATLSNAKMRGDLARDEAYLLTMDKSILEEIMLEEIAARLNTGTAVKETPATV